MEQQHRKKKAVWLDCDPGAGTQASAFSRHPCRILKQSLWFSEQGMMMRWLFCWLDTTQIYSC
jgi:hypothetical protein